MPSARMKVANKPYLSSPGPGGGGEDVKELGRCHQASSGFRRDRGLGQGQGWGLGAGRIEGGEKVEGRRWRGSPRRRLRVVFNF